MMVVLPVPACPVTPTMRSSVEHAFVTASSCNSSRARVGREAGISEVGVVCVSSIVCVLFHSSLSVCLICVSAVYYIDGDAAIIVLRRDLVDVFIQFVQGAPHVISPSPLE